MPGAVDAADDAGCVAVVLAAVGGVQGVADIVAGIGERDISADASGLDVAQRTPRTEYVPGGPRDHMMFLWQLVNLETELRDTGIVYTCPPGQHDDLGISCAMLNWAARHPHLDSWVRMGAAHRRPRIRRPPISWKAWT